MDDDQNVLHVLTEVLQSVRADQSDRAVYRLDPAIPCPTRQAKTDGRARINLEREESEDDQNFSLLVHLARTACTGDRTDDLASLFDPMMDFSLGYFSKARILKLSEDLGHVGHNSSVKDTRLAVRIILRPSFSLTPWTHPVRMNLDRAIPRPTRQAKIDGRARINLEHEESEDDQNFSILVSLARTACTSDRTDDLASLFDPIMDFSLGHFSKARILVISEELGLVGTQLVREGHKTGLPDHPSSVLLLTATDPSNSDEPGQ
ncbi:hypothetical protein YC2023_089464 [Brassica napus]